MAGDSIDRLTEREKEALRLWLDHKTAKEIAIELGVSHHAVEKRLKMARTKLGVESSLEAARLLAEEEGYERTVTHAPDLPAGSDQGKSWRHQHLFIGGIAMFSATILALATVATSQSDQTEGIEIDGNIEPVFELLDKDQSGYLENPESPFVAVAFLDTVDGEMREGEAVIGDGANPDHVAEFYAAADTDSDGRVSFREYYVWSEKRWSELDVEISTIVRATPLPES